MKTLTVRLPEALVAQIEAESRRRQLSKSDVVRERLTAASKSPAPSAAVLDAIADVVGSVDGLPPGPEHPQETVPEVDRLWREARSLIPVFL
jgi:Arc/MetJ-type ribon-helix-helix transcriptional regulator